MPSSLGHEHSKLQKHTESYRLGTVTVTTSLSLFSGTRPRPELFNIPNVPCERTRYDSQGNHAMPGLTQKVNKQIITPDIFKTLNCLLIRRSIPPLLPKLTKSSAVQVSPNSSHEKTFCEQSGVQRGQERKDLFH